MLDYIIVGQGIAGSLLSWFLLKEKQHVLVIDLYDPSSASNIALGAVKPITGNRFVKTWLADQLIPFAETIYTDFEKLFQDKFYRQALFHKLFDSVKAQNDWSARCATPEYHAFLKNENIIYLDNTKVKNDFGGFEINGGSRLETDKFISHYRNYLIGKNLLLNENFSQSELQKKSDFVTYREYKARKIIFCEGSDAIQNPFFKFLPFQIAKGECLFVNIPDFYNERTINSDILIMPLREKNLYYIGATHEWYFDDNLPSRKGRNELLGNLNAVLKCKYEVVDHKAAIRPTVKDRRPFIGFHPLFPQIGIFNGMGTKGVSLAPFFAKHFTDHLMYQKPLMKEIDIQRFA